MQYVPYMPDVTFTIVDKHFTLTPKEYVLKTSEGIATVCLSGFLEIYSWGFITLYLTMVISKWVFLKLCSDSQISNSLLTFIY